MRRALLALLLLFIMSGCDSTSPPDKCDPVTQQYSFSFNTATATGAPIARFTLNQIHTSFSPAGCNLAGESGPVTLTLTGIAPVPLAFTYTLQGVGATGFVVWTYNGAVNRLAPGQSIVVGQVANTPVRVDVGAGALITTLAQVP